MNTGKDGKTDSNLVTKLQDRLEFKDRAPLKDEVRTIRNECAYRVRLVFRNRIISQDGDRLEEW